MAGPASSHIPCFLGHEKARLIFIQLLITRNQQRSAGEAATLLRFA